MRILSFLATLPMGFNPFFFHLLVSMCYVTGSEFSFGLDPKDVIGLDGPLKDAKGKSPFGLRNGCTCKERRMKEINT